LALLAYPYFFMNASLTGRIKNLSGRIMSSKIFLTT